MTIKGKQAYDKAKCCTKRVKHEVVADGLNTYTVLHPSTVGSHCHAYKLVLPKGQSTNNWHAATGSRACDILDLLGKKHGYTGKYGENWRLYANEGRTIITNGEYRVPRDSTLVLVEVKRPRYKYVCEITYVFSDMRYTHKHEQTLTHNGRGVDEFSCDAVHALRKMYGEYIEVMSVHSYYEKVE